MATGTTYSPNISATTDYYVESVATQGSSSSLTLPSKSPYTGNSRGYYFTAPTDFVITSVYIPTTHSSGSQNIAIVRFNGQTAPPTPLSGTNAFKTLFVTQNNTTAGSIAVNVVVRAGDVIGFLGARDNVSSYANSYGDISLPITIAGTVVQAKRMGMQFQLRNTLPKNIFAENGELSRVEFEYTPICVSTPRALVTATVTEAPCSPSVLISSDDADNSITSGTSVTFTATPTNGGATPSYQWKKNSNDVGTNSAAYTDAALATGDKITCILTSNAACASPTTATSNEITMTVCSPVTPVVSIAANPTGSITSGTSVTFTAIPTNGGTTPAYQWKKNGNNVGTNSATYTDAALADGDKITCVLTSNDACASPTTATSNEITMTVVTCTNPTAYNVTGGGAYCEGAAGVVVGLASSESGVTYQLKKDNVDDGAAVDGTGSAISFSNKTATGVYTVVATRTTGGCNANMNGSATVSITALPTAHNVTGGGSYCAGGTGVVVGLSSSQTGVT